MLATVKEKKKVVIYICIVKNVLFTPCCEERSEQKDQMIDAKPRSRN